jgi:DNA-binding GntR family transcriptional regulator
LTVYEQLYADILSGDLSAGSALVEATLASRYGTSRTPVREALRRLEQDGLLERRARSLRVRSTSPEEILEVYEVRIALEGIAARSAAEKRGDLDLMRLRAAAEDMRNTQPAEPQAIARSNRRFHESLWAASHNSTLIDLLRRLEAHLLRYPETTLSAPGRLEEALDEHDGLVEAIASRDEHRARQLAETHMTAARDIRIQQYSRVVGDGAESF